MKAIIMLSVVVFQVAGASIARADPTGDNYNVSTQNLGNSGGALSGPVTFDGVEESVGPLFVNEHSFPWLGNPLFPGTAFEIPGGDAIEIWVRADQPLIFLTDNLNGFSTSFEDITILPPGLPVSPRSHGKTAFLYLTVDGVPQPMFDAGGAGLTFFAHPWDASVPQVLGLGEAPIFVDLPFRRGDVDFNFVFSPDLFFQPELSWPLFLSAVGLNAQITTINDLHFGFIVDVPEPSACAILVTGLFVLVPLLRRRRVLANRGTTRPSPASSHRHN